MEKRLRIKDILKTVILPRPGGLLYFRLFKKALAQGEWIAWGAKVPVACDSKIEKIPAHLWEFLEIDLIDERAYANGIEFIDLKFSPSISRKAPGRPSEKETVQGFYRSIEESIKRERKLPSKNEIAGRIQKFYQQEGLEVPEKRTIKNHISEKYEELKPFFDQEKIKREK